jgi:hypothetical protein
MKNFKRTDNQDRILKSMDLVYEKLIDFNKSKNSDLIVVKNNKIVRVKP